MTTLSEEISNEVAEMFSKDLDDIPVQCTYLSFSDNPSYSAASQSILPAPLAVYSIHAVIDNFRMTRISSPDRLVDDEAVLSIDRKFIIPANILPIKPRMADNIQVNDTGQIWRIVGIIEDPARAHYEFHMRPVN